jgi:SNF2 family DNA or RNA helicase
MINMLLKTSLLPHQIPAYEKLRHLKVGALYMEMGTGKTRTALELVKDRINAGKVNCILWLCPCSVRNNLKNDIIKHVGNMPDYIVIYGIESLSSSDRLYAKLLNLVNNKKVYIIVDESNLVKNNYACRTQRITEIASKCEYKLILNGTPISKNEKDLFAQWYILDWRILGYQSFWSFAANHLEYDKNIPGKVVRALNTDYLVRKIAPYTYQIKKSECLKLPKKVYDREPFNLTYEQYEHYDKAAEELLLTVDEFKPETIYRCFGALQAISSGFKICIGKHFTKTLFFQNPEDNPRIEALLKVIKRYGNDKIIIFCKYSQEIKDIMHALSKRYGNNAAVEFYGELTAKERENSIQKFTNDAQFFVANKTCAGYGLNLQFCHNVIYYNNDWDYATRSQSEDRVHRLGQTSDVNICDIYASGTLDQRILKCLDRKEGLIESFKREIAQQKNNTEAVIREYACLRKGGRNGKSISR